MRYISAMRTTLTIDDDVLLAAKALAEQDGRTVGEVLSRLARKALHRPQSAKTRNGVPLLAARSSEAIVTLDIVNALRDEAP